MGERGLEALPWQVAEPDVGFRWFGSRASALGLDQILSLLCKAGPSLKEPTDILNGRETT